MNSTSGIIFLLFVAISSPAFGGSLTPPGAPAPTMRTLQELWDQLSALTVLSPAQKFSGYAFVPSPSSAGGKSCQPIAIPAGSLVKLESATGVTYNDPTAIAYLRYLISEGGASSRIVIQRLPSDAALTDPVANSRSVNESIALWISGGNVFDVAVGDVHSVNVCIQSSTGNNASGALMLTGIFVTVPAAAAAKANGPTKGTPDLDPTLENAEPQK